MIEWKKRDSIIAGWTMKDDTKPSHFSMALHTGHPHVDIIKNRQTLAEAIQYPLEQFVCAQQTHSANVHKVTYEDAGRGAFCYEEGIPSTDALYTTEFDIVLSTFVADCIPLLFYNERDHIIGAIHSGWQGTLQNIVGTTFATIQNNERCSIEDFHVFVGPSIQQHNFEVDRDVYEKFAKLDDALPFIHFKEETKKWHIDTRGVVQQQLIQSGIPAHHLHFDERCTFDTSNAFSYRQNRQCGRHLGFIVQKKND